MTREEAKELMPIIQAFAEGKQIQDAIEGLTDWVDTDEINLEYEGQKIKHRIKPEPKYRPFRTQEECWKEMNKHHPFGWVRSTMSDNLYLIESISDEINYNRTFASYNESFEWVKFADGTPFGVMEE